MTKTYDVTCADESCLEEFEVEMDPATEEEYVECPACWDQFDWEHDEATDTVTLFYADDADLGADDDEEEDYDEEEDELS